MPGTRCLNCRWWTGDTEHAPSSHDEKLRRGDCERIIGSAAARKETPARLYPMGAGVWLNTRFDFSCAMWEASPAALSQETKEV